MRRLLVSTDITLRHSGAIGAVCKRSLSGSRTSRAAVTPPRRWRWGRARPQ